MHTYKRARFFSLISVLALLVTATPSSLAGSTQAAPSAPRFQAGTGLPPTSAGSRLFPETGKTVRSRFLEYWDTHGGLAQQGYPVSDEMQEKSDTDGKAYTVQYFERAVFEYHPENQPPNDVLLSLLGSFRYRQKYSESAPNQKVNASVGAVTFPQTGKHLGGTFLAYWNAHGGLAQQGYPVSEEFTEASDLDGKAYTVQYFERAVFELHPENRPPYDVLLSQLGAFRYKAKYAAAGGGTGGQAATRPNILFVLTDDLDAKEIEFMPHLKELMVGGGTTFSNFFVTDSLCCPSRSSIQRGQYVHNHGVLGNQAPEGGFQKFYAVGDQNSTVATWLKTGGYRTGLMGKYLNGYPTTASPTYVPPGWDEWDSPSSGDPYSEFNYKLNENGQLVSYGSTPDDYMVDVISRKATTFIKDSSAPFFLYLATYAPHQPATPAPRHASLFPNAQAPRTASYNEADVSDKPNFIKNLPLLNATQQIAIDQLYRKRLQSLQSVDEMLASLVDTLRATNKLDNTYIVFTSDNGFHLGQHRMQMGKQTSYETDIHVPMIVRGPQVPAGKTNDLLTMEVDFGPTFAQLAGVQAPDFVDGRSLVPLFGSNSAPENWRQGVLVEHYAGSDEPFQSDFETMQKAGKGAIPTYKAIRTKDYTYTEYVTGEKELYDLQSDPEELHNIVTTANPTLVQALSARLAELGKCSGANCRSADGAALPGK